MLRPAEIVDVENGDASVHGLLAARLEPRSHNVGMDARVEKGPVVGEKVST